MSYEIGVRTVGPVQLAAIRRQVPPGGLATSWRPALDMVWSFVRARDGLWSGGHNVFVYRRGDGPGDPVTVDFGVEVARPFEGDGVVMATETPAGRIATTVHVGPIDGLAAALAAGVSWETYGDWGADPATWEIWLTYLLG